MRGRGGAIATGVHKEKRGRAIGEGKVRGVCVSWWGVDGSVVNIPGISGGWIGSGGVRIPIICNFMVIKNMKPWEVGGDGRPIGRGVDLAIFTAIGLGIEA